MYALFDGLLHHRCLFWYAGAFDNLVGRENLFLGMLLFLPVDGVVVKQFLVFILYSRHVAHEHVETFLLGQYCGAGTTFASTKNYYSFHLNRLILFLML